MGLKEVFKNAAITITNAFGNVAVETTVTVYGDAVYDEDTDTETIPTTDYTEIKMFFTPYTSYERARGEGLLPTDIKALVPAGQFPEGFKLAPNNEVVVTSSADNTFRSGDRFYVVGEFEIDPAEALFIVNIRAVA